MEEWFEPWKKNIKEAKRLGKELLVYTKKNNSFGVGQVMEMEWLEENGFSYKICPYRQGPVIYPLGTFLTEKEVVPCHPRDAYSSSGKPCSSMLCSICSRPLVCGDGFSPVNFSPMRRAQDYDLCSTCLASRTSQNVTSMVACLQGGSVPSECSRSAGRRGSTSSTRSKGSECTSLNYSHRNSASDLMSIPSERTPSSSGRRNSLSKSLGVNRTSFMTQRPLLQSIHDEWSVPHQSNGQEQQKKKCDHTHELSYLEAWQVGKCEVCSKRINVGDCIGHCRTCKCWSCSGCTHNLMAKATLTKLVGRGKARVHNSDDRSSTRSETDDRSSTRSETDSELSCRKPAKKQSSYADNLLGFAQLNELGGPKARALAAQARREASQPKVGGS